MTYLDQEKSVQDSQPVELFKFEGTYANYFYTSGPVEVEYLGDTYLPITIERSEVKTGTQDDDGLDITVNMSVDQDVVTAYAFTISPPRLSLTVYRQQPDETIIYWTGPVNNISVDGNGRAAFRCPSALGAALTGNIPNVYYQSPCNNVLYDSRCKVIYNDWSQAGTIVAVAADNRTIQLSTIGALDGKLLGGELALENGERRMIVAQAGTTVVVNFPFADLTLTMDMQIAAGCDHNYTGDCKAKFANQANFNGFRFIPPINPFQAGIEPAAEGVTDDACVPEFAEGYWGRVIIEFDQGANIPAVFPFANIYIKRGGVQIQYLTSAGNVQSTEGSPPLCLGETWADSGGGTDPYLGGDPDTIDIQLQFNVGAFPSGGTTGTARAFWQRINETPRPLLCNTGAGCAGGPTFIIYRLWPADYSFTVA